MNQTTNRVSTRGKMLAFLLLLAFFVVIGVPQGQDALADGGSGNDTLTRSSVIDSAEVVSIEKESTSTADMSFGDWLLMMASMLL